MVQNRAVAGEVEAVVARQHVQPHVVVAHDGARERLGPTRIGNTGAVHRVDGAHTNYAALRAVHNDSRVLVDPQP